MGRFLLVCLGGAIGTGARFALSTAVARALGPGFPVGTLLVNVTGSFLLAAIVEVSLRTGLVSPDLRLFLTAGVMGGYTTYSSFNYETLRLAQDGRWGLVTANLAATVVGCAAAGIVGLWAGRLVAGGAR